MAQVDVKIGSVWRENDKRFERYVKVVAVGKVKKDIYTGKDVESVEICICGPNGLSSYADPSSPARSTKARLSRFSKAYKLVKDAV